MPAVLSEGMFIILPDQEKALRSAQGQQRYALGIFEGVRAFLARRAEGQLPYVGQPRPGASPKAHPNSAPRAPAAAGREHGAAP
jgi:hypothetical protein